MRGGRGERFLYSELPSVLRKQRVGPETYVPEQREGGRVEGAQSPPLFPLLLMGDGGVLCSV